ncbi:HNH endonuclease [Streptococcus constellatus]|mgnify:FL=1|uniref:HNH endonuclease n=1 Tax=Streptococcus constellatus TaxID=76860 RepID=UPI0025522010|nr:HNH endonuclease signature motif containing protein [Streptococcus constellatus]MDK6972587.1 HNH endonuclease signature motif containing protein [Streptococcus constellatus]
MTNKEITMNKRLKRKAFDYSQVFDAAIESYREDTAAYLKSRKKYCLSQNENFIFHAKNQDYNLFREAIKEDEFKTFKEKMVKLYSEKFSNKKYSVQKYYDEIKLLSPNNICPYCLKREVRNLDHFLPKTEYPSLSISDANLIPSCSDCNHDKLNSTEIYINYYFEEIDDAPYMKCYADFNDGDINFRYELVKPSSWDDDKFNRLKNQFEQTKLLKFYAEQAKIEYSRKEKSFRRSIKDSSSYSERLKFEISDLIADEEETLGINSLEAALWRGLNEDGEKLFEHIRLLPIR